MTEPQGTVQLPPQLSTIAPEVDDMYYLIYWISVVFFVVITGAMLYFMYKYRRRPGRKAKAPGHATALEIAWTVAPLFLLVYLFHMGFQTYIHGSVAPDDAVDVRVRAMQWNWEFEHPGGVIDEMNLFKVPVNKPVRVIMSSSDVLHSLFIPAFRVKRDAVPGMYTSLWFEATELTDDRECEVDADCPEAHQCGRNGTCALPLFCTEYCGAPQNIQDSAGRNTNHSTMMADVRVITQEAYQEFLELGPPPPPECEGSDDMMECWGEQLYAVNGCVGCHRVDGSAGPAPTWQGLWGAQRAFDGGGSAVADENYIRESILQPQANIVEGYTAVNMPPYRLSDRQIDAIIAYMQTLSE